jgi:hypothetical protein
MSRDSGKHFKIIISSKNPGEMLRDGLAEDERSNHTALIGELQRTSGRLELQDRPRWRTSCVDFKRLVRATFDQR